MSPISAVSTFLLLATATFMFAIFLPVTEGNTIPSSQCYFSGYKPGGNVPVIADVSTVPPQKFETSALDNVLDYFNKGGTVAVTTLTVIDSLGVALKGSPQVSAALGVVAVALGYASDSPSPNEILDKAMKSVDLLAGEVNERMRQMQDYVDVSVLELEKRIMTNNYKELFHKWAKCAKHRPGRDPNQCQQDAEEDITSARYHFQPLEDLFDAKQSNGKQKYDPHFSFRYVATWQWMKEYEGRGYFWAPTYDQVKRLEVGLIPFRDYATLHLLVLETLANSFKEKQICASYKHTLNLIVRKSDYYVRYVKWAYEWIYIRQYEENMYFGVEGRVGGGSASAKRNGYMATYECEGATCTIECIQMMKDNVCKVKNKGRSIDKAYELCGAYTGQLKQALVEFWTKVALDVTKRWERYGEAAKEKLDKLKC